MISLPFIYFLILFIVVYKRRGLDISSFTVFLYVITSLCSIIGYYLFPDELYTKIGLLPTLIYCFLITLSILPLYRFNSNELQGILLRNEKTIDIIIYLFFVGFLFTIITYKNDLLFRIRYSDWGELRAFVYQGNAYEIHHLSGILGIIERFFSFINQASFIVFPLFFSSICYYKKPWWYYIVALLGTTSSVLTGMLSVERSSAFKWIVFLAFSLVLFWPHLQHKIRRTLIPIIGVSFLFVFIYFFSVSNSRFGDSDNGTREGLITYAAKPFMNFCNFFDNYDNGLGLSTKVLFPGIHTYFLKDHSGGVSYQEEMSIKSGMDCGTFYSFLGWFILGMNQIGPFVFILLYLFMFALFPKPVNSKISITGFLLNYVLLAIPAYGCIAYLYMYGSSTFSVIVVLIMVKLLESIKF